MKKSLVAIGIVAVLGGAWVGGAWYTGKQIQTQIETSIAEAQTRLDKLGYKANVKISDYQRGIFSSQATYTVTVAEKGQSDTVSLLQTISHGPFPLAKFSLAPKLAYSQISLMEQASLKDLFVMTEGKSPFTASVLTGYSGDSELDFTLLPLREKTEGGLTFSGTTFNGQVRVQGDTRSLSLTGSPLDLNELGSTFRYDALKLDVAIDKDEVYTVTGRLGKTVMTSPSDEEEAGQEQIQWDELTVNSRGKTGSFGMNMGQVDVALKNMNISKNGTPYSTIEGLKVNSNAQESGKFINQTVDVAVDKLSVEGKNMGSGSAKIKLDNFDGKTLQYFNQNSNILVYMLSGIPLDPNSAQGLNANLMTFLEGNPTLSIAPFVWKNDKGESQLDTSLTLMRPADLGEQTDPVQQIVSLTKSFSSKVKLSVPMMIEQARMTAELEGNITGEEAQAQASDSIRQLIDMGVNQKLLTKVDDNTATFSLNYADAQVDLNGQKMPLESFLALFFGPGFN
ncbi:hypothetical protein SOASR030_07840 [Leminorella grimontii]|uniref:DUF945 domain-containing protein n=1 Tax=Leminorella grimontii TaxID=82981 RepID=A0AAV5N1W9_9GAMM|nr:YdgA family protein [Leminorella grimontii]KFC96142.1 putative GTP-binding protein [Leminorella grimontii ATCC 33999 = DSM 5078]GKX54672.1 hypothetical protein SOASR030_07840 [Leminorella grimontii]VFS58691.1 Bacterial protein of uncharacterised function (DUF945) [Leminorella grimontii]